MIHDAFWDLFLEPFSADFETKNVEFLNPQNSDPTRGIDIFGAQKLHIFGSKTAENGPKTGSLFASCITA